MNRKILESKVDGEINHIVNLVHQARKTFLDSDIMGHSDAKLASSNIITAPVQIFKQAINGKQYRFFGVDKEKQSQIDFNSMRASISKELVFVEATKYLQIIGDSSIFSEEGTAFCSEYLSSYLQKHQDCIVLYGLTGNLSGNGKEGDTNQLE